MANSQTARAPQLFIVPAGTKPTMCNGSTCGRMFYWVRTANGPKPIDCDVEGGKKPSETKDVGQLDAFGGEAEVHDGIGVLHSTRCPNRGDFTGGNR
jgi:hypothetical protein